MADFNWIAPGAAQQDALTQIMLTRAAKQRQAMLDSIAAQDRAEKTQQQAAVNARADANLKIQQAQETRAQQSANAATFAPGDVMTPEQAAGVNSGLVTPGTPAVTDTVKPATLEEAAAGGITPGIIASSAPSISNSGPGSSTFRGAPTERTAEKKTANEKAFGKFLTENQNISRQAATAAALNYDIDPKDIDSLVDKMLPAVKEKTHSQIYNEYQDYLNAKVDEAGGKPVQVMTFEEYMNEDANRKRPVTNVNTATAMDMSPEAMRGDVEDILAGRNSTYALRQTMGRTNAAASYMQKLRAAIKAEDPKFDFNLSDAGSKAVSSNYYQRSISAVNSVLPNIDKVAELSKDVDRLGVKGIDAILQKTAMQFGDTKVTSLHQARKMLADEIGLALGQGTVSDMKLQLGFDVTDPAVSDENFVKNMALVKEFVNNRKAGLEQLRYHSSTVPGSSATGDAGVTPPATAPKPLTSKDAREKYGY
jgi:hypothetical protein